MTTLQNIGPQTTTLGAASATLQGLWQIAGVPPVAPTETLVVVTEQSHLQRVQGVLGDLSAERATRQCIILVSSRAAQDAAASLVRIGEVFVERLDINCSPTDLPELLGALVRPAVATQLWWACDDAPGAGLLRSVARRYAQVILDTLTDAPVLVACPLADLSWARTAPWRALIGPALETLDPDGSAPLRSAVVRYSVGDDRPARLFAAWLTDRLNWESPAQVQLVAVHSERSPGDIDGAEVFGVQRYGLWEALQGTVLVRLTVNGVCTAAERPLPDLRIVDGLSRLMARPGEGSSHVLHLARQLETDLGVRAQTSVRADPTP